jgi:hypothetical protein
VRHETGRPIRGPVTGLFLALAATALAARPQDTAALLATWKDGEIRESFDAAARISQLSVAVMPAGQHGSLTVVMSARWPGRTRLKPIDEFEIRADVGLHVNPNLIRQPTMLFVLDPDADRSRVLDLTERLRNPPTGAGSAIDTGKATISVVELIQLLRARSLAAEIFALPLTFTPEQLEALRRFGDRVLAPPQ